ncbi:uncharacterized protein DS421_19g660670 [Arachis hypogaea]|uniref:Uncharacterized protein n=1 Tax=Arachis hypogaea TaxID=3818 RepID=A0A6B9V988_ARAHY|nr:uncharacterized protein DS421_19g660670 [Arachis hypogaea]
MRVPWEEAVASHHVLQVETRSSVDPMSAVLPVEPEEWTDYASIAYSEHIAIDLGFSSCVNLTLILRSGFSASFGSFMNNVFGSTFNRALEFYVVTRYVSSLRRDVYTEVEASLTLSRHYPFPSYHPNPRWNQKERQAERESRNGEKKGGKCAGQGKELLSPRSITSAATPPCHHASQSNPFPLLPPSRRRGIEEGPNSRLVAAVPGASSRVAVLGDPRAESTRAGWRTALLSPLLLPTPLLPVEDDAVASQNSGEREEVTKERATSSPWLPPRQKGEWPPSLQRSRAATFAFSRTEKGMREGGSSSAVVVP